MTQARRVLVARLWHESHSFNPRIARIADFERHEWSVGDGTAGAYRGTRTELGAVVDLMDRQLDLDVHFSLCAGAWPAGPVHESDMRQMHQIILDDAAGGPWHGVYISLHGAMLATETLSPDIELLRGIRERVGPAVPIAISMDMHACVNPAIADVVQMSTGYQTYPHIDFYETGERAMTMLMRSIREGIAYRLHILPIPILPLSHMMRTESGPMRELVDLARQQTNLPGIADATFFASFTYADTPYSSAVATITAEAGIDVGPSIERMAGAFLARRERFRAPVIHPLDGLSKAAAFLASEPDATIAIVDTADNPASGGIGDTTGLLRAYLESGLQHRAVFAFFFDPGLVERAHALGVGAAIDCELGGRLQPEFGAPVQFAGTIAKITDGTFINEGPMFTGRPSNLGRTAVLQRGPLSIMVSETCQSVNDYGWCRLHNFDLPKVQLFMVKAKNHFRASFAEHCRHIIDIESPGPSPSDLHTVPFVHVPKSYLI